MPLLLVVAGVGYTSASENTHWVLPEMYLFCKGFGMGGIIITLIHVVLHAVPREKHATTMHSVPRDVLLGFRLLRLYSLVGLTSMSLLLVLCALQARVVTWMHFTGRSSWMLGLLVLR